MIDLKPVVSKYNAFIDNGTRLKSLLFDIYPLETLDRNIIMSIFDSGVVDRLKKSGKITLADMKKFIKTVEDSYGINPELIQDGILAWAEAFSLVIDEDARIDFHEKPSQNKATFIIQSFEETGSCNDYEYEILPDDTVEITNYTGSDEPNVIVPGCLNGRKVTVIGEKAFFSNGDDIVNLVISENIKVIDDYAFASCFKLKTITFPDSLERINDNAFENCEALRNINWGNGLWKIDSDAFQNCKKLYSLILPSSLEYIDMSVFWGCTMLKSISFKNRQSKLKEIQSTAFYDCSSLETIELPSDTVEFRYQAFDGLRKERLTVYCHANSDTYAGLLEEGINVKILPRK